MGWSYFQTRLGRYRNREEARKVVFSWPESPERLRDLWYDLTRLDQQVPADRKPALDAAVLASLALFAEGMGSK